MKRDVLDIYSYFTSTLYKDLNNEFFYIRLTSGNRKALIDFLAQLHIEIGLDSIDRDYIFDYCSYQFEYILAKTPRYSTERIPFRSVFNKAALKRWMDKTSGYMYYVSKSLEEKGIDRRHINPQKIHIRSSIDLISIEEVEKSRFINTPKGFDHCIISTSLYNHTSINCTRCIHRDRCKTLLKKTFLPIYVDRGYQL